MARKLSLAELMGVDAAKAGNSGTLRLNKLPEILGDAMPELPRNAVGRYRLIRALGQRFGPNWRSLPGVKDLISEFDDVVDLELRVAKIKKIKYRPGGKS